MIWTQKKGGGYLRVVTLLGVAMAVAALGCSSTPTPKGDSETAPPIESESREVRERFENALQLLEQGLWDEALEEFRLVQALHTGDVTAALAELYVARALMADLDAHFRGDQEQEGMVVPQQVYQTLQGLTESEVVDSRIRSAAQGYLATAYAAVGDTERSLTAMEGYPGPSISPVVLRDDKIWIWPLIAEGLSHHERHGDAVVAWGSYYEEILDYAEAQEQLQQLDGGQLLEEAGLAPQANLAVSRAFGLEPAVNGDLARLLNSDLPLVRAVGAWTHIRQQLADNPTPEDVEVLQQLFNEVSGQFLLVGAAERASELAVSLAALGGPERLVIGALVPLSGPNRAVGYRALAGMLIAQRAFHAAGEPALTLIIEDSHRGVVEGYERLVQQGALAVVGPLQTGEARALVDAATRDQVPLLTLSADRVVPLEEMGEAPESTAPIFRNFVDAVAEARAAAYLSFERFGDRRAAVVYPEMGYGRVLSKAFVEEFRRLGGEIVAEVDYDRNQTDFVAEARRVARAGPDAIFLPDTGAKVAEISAFFAQEDIWGISPSKTRSSSNRQFVHYLGTSLWQDPILLHQAASYVEGATVPAWYSPVFDDRDSEQFTRAVEAIYSRGADQFMAFSYDSVLRLRTHLLERGISDSSALVEALKRPQWEPGATGRHQFQSDGEPRRELRYLEVQDGEWRVSDATVMTPLQGRPEAPSEQEIEALEDPNDGGLPQPPAEL